LAWRLTGRLGGVANEGGTTPEDATVDGLLEDRSRDLLA